MRIKCEVVYFNKGKGGQNVNRNKNGVKLIHRESGITVSIIDTRSRNQNMKIAKEVMAKRLSEYYTRKKREELTIELVKCKNDKIIRTYNEKRGTAKDHRSKLTLRLDDGITLSPENLDTMIESVRKVDVQTKEN